MVPGTLPCFLPAWNKAKPTTHMLVGLHWERLEHGFTPRLVPLPWGFPHVATLTDCGFPKWHQQVTLRSSNFSVLCRANARIRKLFERIKTPNCNNKDTPPPLGKRDVRSSQDLQNAMNLKYIEKREDILPCCGEPSVNTSCSGKPCDELIQNNLLRI